MGTPKTFYIINGIMLFSSEGEDASVAARRFRDAWKESQRPRAREPFSVDRVGVGYAKTATDLKPYGNAGKLMGAAPKCDHSLARLISKGIGDADATVYILDLHNPNGGSGYSESQYRRDREEYLEDRRDPTKLYSTLFDPSKHKRGPEAYPEPRIEVLRKPKGEDRLETLDCMGLREFVATNLDRDDPDQSVLYNIKLGRAAYAVVAGSKIKSVLHAINAREGDEYQLSPMTNTKDHCAQLQRALADHERRTKPSAPAPNGA